jgi:hypothetical protein
VASILVSIESLLLSQDLSKIDKRLKVSRFYFLPLSLASSCSLAIMVVLKKHGKMDTKCFIEICGYQNQES